MQRKRAAEVAQEGAKRTKNIRSAIRNMKIDKVTVWDGGSNTDGSSATSNFVSSLVQSLPPIHDVAKMAGVDLPDYLGSLSEDNNNE